MEASWRDIIAKKRESLHAKIPSEWRISKEFIPTSMLSADESIAAVSFEKTNVMNVPRACGILSEKELQVTENWDINGLLGELRAGRLSAVDVCRAFCKRAAIAHQVTRCLTEPLFQDALERASELDSHFSRTHETIGPLHGLPVSVKDCFDIEGVDSTIGMAYHAFRPAKANAPLVDLLRSLGAVIIAKTNVPQSVGAFDSVNYVFGRTMNPLNYNLSAGGSSGGEAALVAMRGSMIGIGTDFGGSIRVPAMCCGIYGLKPSTGRLPYGGQSSLEAPGKDRMVVKAVAGPIARSVEDIKALMKALIPYSENFGVDCIPGKWESETPALQGGKPHKFTIGVLRHDGLVDPLPPIANVLNEVVEKLRKVPGVEIVEVSVPKLLSKCQTLANRLAAIDGAYAMFDKIESTSEPLIPWIKARMRRGKPMNLDQILKLQAQRDEIEKEALAMWRTSTGAKVDAIIHPVAPHPVTEVDKFNVMSYTINWTTLDYPAATIPVRPFTKADLDVVNDLQTKPLNNWDKKNRDLWDSKSVDRQVYLDSPLSVQVIAPRLHEFDLTTAMALIDHAIQGNSKGRVSRL